MSSIMFNEETKNTANHSSHNATDQGSHNTTDHNGGHSENQSHGGEHHVPVETLVVYFLIIALFLGMLCR